MNYLAHLYLTKEQPDEVAVGNFMADSIKGRKAMLEYSNPVQRGIQMHRQIDSFADSHPLFRRGTKRLHKNYGKFAPIIMDIYYDHILACHWGRYASDSLPDFAQSQYQLMRQYKPQLTEAAARWLHIMTRDSLLESYASEAGIDSVLQRMDKRTGGVSGMRTAINELRLHKAAYTEEFFAFFDEMQIHLRGLFKRKVP